MERELSFIENAFKELNINNGIEALQKFLSKYKSNQTSLKIALERIYLAGIAVVKNSSKQIIPVFQILAKLCKILEDWARLCDVKNSLSFCFRSNGQVNLALKECLEALEIAGDRKELIGKLSALHLNACAIYREDIKDLSIAKTHAELAYFFSKEQCNLSNERDKRTYAVCCFNYGVVLEEMKDKPNALTWFKEGLRFCEEKWEDPVMEHAFREKVQTISPGEGKKPSLLQKRTSSQKPSMLKRYHFTKEPSKFFNRPTTNKSSLKRKTKKQSMTPISRKTLPFNSLNLEKQSFYTELEEVRSRPRNSNTPSSSLRNPRVYSETYSKPVKLKLSLVQSVIKIQRWFRKMFKKTVKLKSDYLLRSVRVFYGVKYFLSVIHSQNQFIIEAWPLVRRMKKPENAGYSLYQLCQAVGISETESCLRESLKMLSESIMVHNSQILISKVSSLFKGPQIISGYDCQVHIWLHSRILEIDAVSPIQSFSCSVKLDPLQDLHNLKSKVDFILKSLSIESGELIFNLI
jgi:tetratricopeptide (TPR) repeat protein